jgi:hypothetical protein
MEACYDSVFSEHSGKAQMKGLIGRMFYWLYISREIHKYVSGGATCHRVKPNSTAPQDGLQPILVTEGKRMDVTVNMVTELSCTIEGYNAIIVSWIA